MNWPYPKWIAHRGAGKLAPENTLAAFRKGANFGFTMFECDVKLSADDVPYLLHDDTLDRTTDARISQGDGKGFTYDSVRDGLISEDQPWSVLSQLDAGSWLSEEFKGERLPTLMEIADWCISHDVDINIEIKPNPGTDKHTGDVVARYAARLWKDSHRKPLLSSFSPEALEAARDSEPSLLRGMLFESPLNPRWAAIAKNLECAAVIFDFCLWTPENILAAKNFGLKTLSYTVNDLKESQRLQSMGIDGIITDRVDFFAPDRYDHDPSEDPQRLCARCGATFHLERSNPLRLIALHRQNDSSTTEILVCENCLHDGDVVPMNKSSI